MLGPFATASRFTLPFTRCRYRRTPPLSHAVCASMSTTTTTTTTRTRERGDRYGPMEWAQLAVAGVWCCVVRSTDQLRAGFVDGAVERPGPRSGVEKIGRAKRRRRPSPVDARRRPHRRRSVAGDLQRHAVFVRHRIATHGNRRKKR